MLPLIYAAGEVAVSRAASAAVLSAAERWIVRKLLTRTSGAALARGAANLNRPFMPQYMPAPVWLLLPFYTRRHQILPDDAVGYAGSVPGSPAVPSSVYFDPLYWTPFDCVGTTTSTYDGFYSPKPVVNTYGCGTGAIADIPLEWDHNFIGSPSHVASFGVSMLGDSVSLPGTHWQTDVQWAVTSAQDAIDHPPVYVPATPPVPARRGLVIPRSFLDDANPLVTLLPELQPILGPGIQPGFVPYWLLPYVKPNPFVIPDQQTQVEGPDPAPLPPYVVPAIVTTVQPGRKPVTVSGSHYRTPPRRNEKERKLKMPSGALGVALKAALFATEVLDAVDAVYGALPKHMKLRYRDTRFIDKNPSPQAKMKRIYEVWDDISDADVQRIAIALAKETASDKIAGTLASGAKDNLRKLGVTSTRVPRF